MKDAEGNKIGRGIGQDAPEPGVGHCEKALGAKLGGPPPQTPRSRKVTAAPS